MESYVCCRMKDLTVLGIIYMTTLLFTDIENQQSLHLMLEKSQDYQILLIIILLIMIELAIL